MCMCMMRVHVYVHVYVHDAHACVCVCAYHPSTLILLQVMPQTVPESHPTRVQH